MQLDEYGAAARGVQFVDYPRNERERTRMLNERSDAREAVISAAKSDKDARNLIAMLGLDSDAELLAMRVAEPVPSDASPAGFKFLVEDDDETPDIFTWEREPYGYFPRNLRAA